MVKFCKSLLKACLFIVLILASTKAFAYKAFALSCPSDSISPTIITPAANMNVTCNVAVLDSFELWFLSGGGMKATDNKSKVTFQSNITLQTAFAQLEADRNTKCSKTGSVSVGFYATDSCGNSSILNTATFSVIDTFTPKFSILPRSNTVQCNAGRLDSLRRWIFNRGGAMVTDECSSTAAITLYEYKDNAGNQGAGPITESVEIGGLKTN